MPDVAVVVVLVPVPDISVTDGDVWVMVPVTSGAVVVLAEIPVTSEMGVLIPVGVI